MTTPPAFTMTPGFLRQQGSIWALRAAELGASAPGSELHAASPASPMGGGSPTDGIDPVPPPPPPPPVFGPALDLWPSWRVPPAGRHHRRLKFGTRDSGRDEYMRAAGASDEWDFQVPQLHAAGSAREESERCADSCGCAPCASAEAQSAPLLDVNVPDAEINVPTLVNEQPWNADFAAEGGFSLASSSVPGGLVFNWPPQATDEGELPHVPDGTIDGPYGERRGGAPFEVPDEDPWKPGSPPRRDIEWWWENVGKHPLAHWEEKVRAGETVESRRKCKYKMYWTYRRTVGETRKAVAWIGCKLGVYWTPQLKKLTLILAWDEYTCPSETLWADVRLVNEPRNPKCKKEYKGRIRLWTISTGECTHLHTHKVERTWIVHASVDEMRRGDKPIGNAEMVPWLFTVMRNRDIRQIETHPLQAKNGKCELGGTVLDALAIGAGQWVKATKRVQDMRSHQGIPPKVPRGHHANPPPNVSGER